MRKQRNNLAGLPFETREIVCRMLHDGAPYAKIRAELGLGAPGVKIHNSTLLAYAKSAEFTEYVASRRQWDDKLQKRRWAAGILNDGKGPQSLADMAELAILEQLHDLAEGGLLETGKDVANVARAITAMQRTQLARADSAKDAEIAKLKQAHEAERISLEEEIGGLQTEIKRLAGLLQGAGIDPAAGAGQKTGITPAVIANIKAIYGIKEEKTAGGDTGAPKV